MQVMNVLRRPLPIGSQCVIRIKRKDKLLVHAN
jgi:hypothetical protein